MITIETAIKAYIDLILLRRFNVLIKDKSNLGIIEIHHILPKSCGGLDVPENKVALYAKEHFMAHVYLWIIHHEDEFHYLTTCALNQMVKGSLNGLRLDLREFIVLSEEYLKAREEFAKFASITMSNTMSNIKNNPSTGKFWIHHSTYKISFLVSKDLFWMYIGEGWRKGRVMNWDNYITPEQRQELKQLQDIQDTKDKEDKNLAKLYLLKLMYEEFNVNEFLGVVKKFGYLHTRNALIMSFKSFIPEYIPKVCNRWKNRK